MIDSIYRFSAQDNSGATRDLSEFNGQVLLIVNTASECGFTPQYKGLQELFEKYSDQGFSVLAFPCNQFGQQEPGSDEKISSFCSTNYQTTFPIFAKVDVNGEGAHPLFQYLREELPGVMGTKKIKWNFTKFLIDRQGVPVERFSPQTDPQKIAPEIEKLL